MANILFETVSQKVHTYAEVWEVTDLHCPSCGEQRIQRLISGYESDGSEVCLACGTYVTIIPGLSVSDTDEKTPGNQRRAARLAVLREKDQSDRAGIPIEGDV